MPMICPWCTYDNVASATLCGDCGRSLRSDPVCDSCGVPNPPSSSYCDACGAQLSGPGRPGPSSAPTEEPPQTEPALPRPVAPTIEWDTPSAGWEMSAAYARSWVARHRWELLLVALFTGVAAFLRIYRLADLPPGLHGDEAWTGIDAMRILKEGWIGPYVGSALGQPTGPLYFTALVFKVADPSLFTVRLSMALFSVATVPLAYLLFRMGFNRWVAVFGTLALTFSFWNIHFSRTAFMVISMPMVLSLAGIAIFGAMRSARSWPWFVAGLILGIGVYTYNGYPLFLAVVTVVLAVHLALLRGRWRRYVPRYLLLAAGTALAALPMILFAVESRDFYLSHARQLSVLRDPRYVATEGVGEKFDFFSRRAWDAATLLLRHPDVDYTDASGGRGALDPYLALLAYLGLAVSLARWRSPPHLLSALAVLAGMGIIVFGAVNWGEMRRSLVAVPFVYGLAGVGAWWLVTVGRRLFANVGRRAVMAGLAAGLVVAMAWNTWYYFGSFVGQEHTKWVYVNDLVDSLAAAHSFDTPGRIYFYSARWSFDYETRRFLYPESPGVDRSCQFRLSILGRREPDCDVELERVDSGPVTYLFLPPYDRELDKLMELYPGGTVVRDSEPGGAPRFVVYHLP